MTTDDLLMESADIKQRLSAETLKLEVLTQQLQDSLERLKTLSVDIEQSPTTTHTEDQRHGE